MRLGATRQRMLEPVTDHPRDAAPEVTWTATNPRWLSGPDLQNQYAALWLRHDAFGWTLNLFPRKEALAITREFRKALTKIKDAPDPTVSSFGGAAFKMTTEGLGFYYYGTGAKRIEHDPFEQVEFDSDRAAGLVAGAIVERRLEEAIRSRFSIDDPEVSKELFHPSGPIGPFRVKIDLAYSLGIVSDVAHKDLSNLKDIRNRFAHNLTLDSFEAQSIRDRCNNLILIDRHVGPIPSMEDSGSELSSSTAPRPSLYRILPDYKQRIGDPRFRYVMTAQIFNFLLGMGADDPKASLPLI
jgi:DNA-binding MltR family transcriptional regulator